MGLGLIIDGHQHERILIGESISITIVKIKGNAKRVKIGITAPREIPIKKIVAPDQRKSGNETSDPDS